MGSERFMALTDGVAAVIITIMVLELKPPHGADLASLAELGAVRTLEQLLQVLSRAYERAQRGGLLVADARIGRHRDG